MSGMTSNLKRLNDILDRFVKQRNALQLDANIGAIPSDHWALVRLNKEIIALEAAIDSLEYDAEQRYLDT